MSKTYYFNFNYRFKRGDVCAYCGTVFGCDVESPICGSSTGGYWSACKAAIDDAKKTCEDAAQIKACPQCGRLPSEAYATEFTFGSVVVGALSGAFCGHITFMFAAMCVKYLGIKALAPYLGECFGVGCALTTAFFVYKYSKSFDLFFQAPDANLKAIAKEQEKEEREK